MIYSWNHVWTIVLSKCHQGVLGCWSKKPLNQLSLDRCLMRNRQVTNSLDAKGREGLAFRKRAGKSDHEDVFTIGNKWISSDGCWSDCWSIYIYIYISSYISWCFCICLYSLHITMAFITIKWATNYWLPLFNFPYIKQFPQEETQILALEGGCMNGVHLKMPLCICAKTC